MYNETAILYKETESVNDIGDTVSVKSAKRVFCRVRSIGMKETYQALAVGLKPELSLVLADYLEYDGEKKVEYDGVIYNVIRTFRREGKNEIELVVNR